MADWRVLETQYPSTPSATVRAWAGDAEVAWLDSHVSADSGGAGGRFSMLCMQPLAVVEQFEGLPATLSVRARGFAGDPDGWKLWRTAHARLPRMPRCTHDLSLGWIGYVGFEMGRLLERLPASRHEDLGLPLMRVALFDQGIVLDHEQRSAWAVAAPGIRAALGLPAGPSVADLVDDWTAAQHATEEPPPIIECDLRQEMSRADYSSMLRRALNYIAAGDIYQVNLCQCLRLSELGDPMAVFAAMCRHNPAPYAALLRWGERAVLSVSPELFLRVDGERVLTCPIKGTRPRTGDPVLDASYRAQLMASEKDRAELTMIVDLHRNDLGRVCKPGSVRVVEPRRIEAHPSVFHTVADVTGQLREDCEPLDALTACFPAGSVSGVPKIRAMQIIDELEPVARGAYTGAVGVLGLDGQMTFNVAIRTLQMHRDVATLHVGGGIVADSDIAEEHAETLAKGRGILDALRTPVPAARMD